MRTGEVEANILRLNETTELSYIDELVDRKSKGPEKEALDATDLAFYESEYARLTAELENSHANCTLPDLPSARPALNDLLVRLRLREVKP